jgi:hypothetical protein
MNVSYPKIRPLYRDAVAKAQLVTFSAVCYDYRLLNKPERPSLFPHGHFRPFSDFTGPL